MSAAAAGGRVRPRHVVAAALVRHPVICHHRVQHARQGLVAIDVLPAGVPEHRAVPLPVWSESHVRARVRASWLRAVRPGCACRLGDIPGHLLLEEMEGW